MHRSRWFAVVPVCLAVLAMPLCAQRGGGGGGGGGGRGGGGGGRAAGGSATSPNRQASRRSEATYDRVGAWFTEVRIEGEPAPVDPAAKKKDFVGALPFVAKAKEEGSRAVVYLFDPSTDADAHTKFETAMSGDDLGIATKLFVCARLDLSATSAKPLLDRYRDEAPLFVVYDDKGVEAATVSMKGYDAAPHRLEAALAKAVGKTVPGGLAAFVRDYGDVSKELEKLEKERSALEKEEDGVDRTDKQKQAEIAKERKALEAEEQKLLAKEREILAKAKPPARPAGAERLGARGAGGRGAGGGRAGGGGGAGGAAPGGADPAGGGGGRRSGG